MRFSERVAVITGAASGIGRACAERFKSEGGVVASLDLQPAGGAGLNLTCDVTDEAAVESALSEVRETFGRIDVLIACAGIAVRSPVHEHTLEAWERCFSVNVRGTFLAAKHALPLFPPRGGSIVLLSSVTGATGVRGRAAYSATKGAIISLTRNMALDYAPRRIRVNCLCPGFVRTPLIDPILRDQQRAERLAALHPLGRLGEPEEIAAAALFLASDEASWITGQALGVDGGFAAGRPEEI